MYPEVLGRDEAAGIADQGRGTSGRAAAAAELLARRGKTLPKVFVRQLGAYANSCSKSIQRQGYPVK
jgi:hypothetical protein